jgi:DNA helicase MCM8
MGKGVSHESPFRAWSLYFPDKRRLEFFLSSIKSLAYNPLDEFVIIAIRLLSFLRAQPDIAPFDTRLSCINANYQSLLSCLGEGVFQRLLEEVPESLLAVLGMAAFEVYHERQPVGSTILKAPARLIGHSPIQPFRELKAFQVGKFVSIQGNVTRVSAVRPFVCSMAFKCAKCLQITTLTMKNGIYRTPTKCSTSNCTGKHFFPDQKSPETKYLNWQKIKIQEITEFDSIEEEGRIPRIIDAELANDLVDSAVPGEIVKMSGILKALESADKFGQNSNAASLYLDVVSVERMNGAKDGPSYFDISGQQLQEILALSQSKTTMQTLVRSFCPHIYGNELVKFGILLALFGGSRRGIATSGSSSNSWSIRSDPHVLIVGDPGLGKSQLLNFASTVAPRAVYVCANTSTAVGLTATVQDGALEAGALVLADQGVCCIDEFDKIIGDGWRSLLDVMEQQTVNVAKAGVVCALPARTSILAAANPVGGHYNKDRNIVENLKMDAALLSRFDITFVLLDNPNADMDKVLSEHVLGDVNSKGGVYRNNALFLSQAPELIPSSLYQKLDPRREIPNISPSLLRQYTSYARQKITPRMTEEAATVLQNAYLEMRRTRQNDETLPVTTRHLESMIRLSEARAKMDLRTFVTIEDAAEVVELLKYSSIATTESRGAHGNTNKGRKGSGNSKSARVKNYVSELITISSRTGETEFTTEQLQALYNTMKIEQVSFRDLLDALNEHGYLLKRASKYRLLVT